MFGSHVVCSLVFVIVGCCVVVSLVSSIISRLVVFGRLSSQIFVVNTAWFAEAKVTTDSSLSISLGLHFVCTICLYLCHIIHTVPSSCCKYLRK